MSGREKGFEIVHDTVRRLLTLRLRGLWDMGMARQFEQEFRKAVEEIAPQEAGWHLLLDFTQCVPQPVEVQQIVGKAVTFAKQQGMSNKAILAKGVLVGFRSSQDSDLQFDFYFQSEVDAIRWLLNEPA